MIQVDKPRQADHAHMAGNGTNSMHAYSIQAECAKAYMRLY